MQILLKCPTPANALKLLQISKLLITFDKVQNPLCWPRETASEHPKVVRTCGVFNFFACKLASRHNGVQLLISHLASWLGTRRFSEPTFRPSTEPQIIEKTHCVATFLPFRAPGSSFFGDFLFSDLVSSSLLISDSSHLCFSICPYCRKFDF